jgi:3-keto-L-gulonate-6-phosphate decarboxylase
MIKVYEIEHARIRDDLTRSISVEDIADRIEDVDIVADALTMNVANIEKKFYRLQGAIAVASHITASSEVQN